MNVSGINEINHIVAVGSVDGVAGTAAVIRHLGQPDITIDFTQAHQVNFIAPERWNPNRVVMFIDLGVNNRDVGMTKEFVQKIHNAGHKILAIADEHDADLWADVMGSSIDSLLIKPVSRSEECYSSCAVLRNAFTLNRECSDKKMDEHTVELLCAGDQGDRGNFDTYFGEIFNNAIKSNMGDRTRRPHLSRHLAFDREADAKIKGWMSEYAEIQENQPKIVAAREDMGDKIFFYDASAVGRHDATSLMMSEYRNGAAVVILNTNTFIKGSMLQVVSIGVNNKSWNLIETLDSAGVPHLGGFAQKVNLSAEHKDAALGAIRELVTA